MAVSSSVFATMLRPFLFENTAHFVHELLLFSRSSLDMAAYDKRALYDDQAVESRSVRYLAQSLFLLLSLTQHVHHRGLLT
jgi:hypothetical protein